MLELGAYWGHYSMWLKNYYPEASVYLVEPDLNNLNVGKLNFKNNGLSGDFEHNFVGNGKFTVDGYINSNNIILDILHVDIQGYELEMIEGARISLANKLINYVFISTHSDDLHKNVIDELMQFGYDIEVSSDFSSETTSYDGLVFASNPEVDRIFNDISIFGREFIANAKTNEIISYLNKLSGVKAISF